jgi:rhamnulose-1-phosphate aldolase/alcohol dehydrogenase
MQEIWGDSMIWIPWQRPGFDLGLQLEAAIRNNPSAKGLILGGHGLFSWGATSYESYCNTLTIIEEASVYLNENYGKKRAVFGGTSKESQSKENRLNLVSTYMPEVRGLASSLRRMVGHFSDDERVLEFVNSNDLNRLAAMGTSCPDHFLRTKIRPLVLPANLEEKLAENPAFLEGLFSRYRSEYQLYYDRCKNPDSPAIRDSNPVILLWPGVGMISFAKDKQTARVASEFYLNAINVMKGAEAVSEYQGLPEQEAFDIEYWLLEEAKLQRMPKEKPLSAKVAFITGAGGGIGKAIAKRLAEEGACVVLAELNEDWKTEAETEFLARFGKDKVRSVSLDVMDQNQIQNAFDFACREFGGVDLLVNCAGLAISKSLETTTEADWNLLQDVLVKGQFLCSQKAAEIFRKQEKGGDIVNIVSKNALVSGQNNIAYGTAKAAQLHMSRLLAAELGKDKIRVNVVNPDAVIGGSKIWEGAWAEGRAKAYGISVAELPAYYASRTLMNEIIYAEDIASAVFAFVGGDLSKCTGNVLNVDGGVAAAFVR